MSLRPITTARAPLSTIPDRSSSSITPDGVHAVRHGRFCTSSPTFAGVNPSTSLAGSMASMTRVSASSPMADGSGDWTRMPSISCRALSAATASSTSVTGASAVTRISSARMPASPAVFILLRT